MLDERLLPPLPRTDQLAPEQAAIAGAVRRWVIAGKLRQCPLRAAAERLGCVQAARHLHLLLESIRVAWPEPFAVAPPCCATLSFDEATLLVMIAAARDHRRPVFDALLCEMLDQDARDRLYAASLALARTIEG
jgi:hypothetical protein